MGNTTLKNTIEFGTSRLDLGARDSALTFVWFVNKGDDTAS